MSPLTCVHSIHARRTTATKELALEVVTDFKYLRVVLLPVRVGINFAGKNARFCGAFGALPLSKTVDERRDFCQMANETIQDKERKELIERKATPIQRHPTLR